MVTVHDTRSPDCLHEREHVRRALLAARPGLRTRMVVGPTGALTIPVRAGRAIEIGRMRRLGRPRWVVVEPMEEGAKVHEPASLDDCARIALAALARWRGSRRPAARQPRPAHLDVMPLTGDNGQVFPPETKEQT